ncbi:MAG: cytochrome c [Gammaproteobacteria bacterium]|nr:cytochrome c [Gammaproteobacteria bacterium]
MQLIRLPLAATLIALLLLIFSHPVLAQDDASFVKYRQKVMGSLGANMGAIAEILKNGLPHRDNIATHASAISLAAKLIPSAFRKQIDSGRTDAERKIWQEWSEFEDAAAKLEREAARLAEVAASGDMSGLGAQVKAVGKSCGGCHKPYRKPKAESYKRR